MSIRPQTRMRTPPGRRGTNADSQTMTSTRSTGNDSSANEDAVTHYVLGGGHVGASVADRLRDAGHTVCVVDESYEPSETCGFQGDPSDVSTLEAAEVGSASTVVVATRSDSRNLLIAQHIRARFDVPRVVVLVNVPDRLDVLADAGHEPICATTALSAALTESV